MLFMEARGDLIYIKYLIDHLQNVSFKGTL